MPVPTDAPTDSIRREIGQQQPFQSAAQAAVVSLMRTASLLRRRFENLADREDLTFQQYNVLRILRGADGPLPTMEIGKRLIEVTPGITRLIGRLETKGLVRRKRSDEDRRRVLCRLTESGRSALQTLDAPMDALDEACMRELNTDEQNTLLLLLDKVRSGLHEMPEVD